MIKRKYQTAGDGDGDSLSRGRRKELDDVDNVYVHARFMPETILFYRFIGQLTQEPALVWQLRAIDGFLEIRPWQGKRFVWGVDRTAGALKQVFFRVGPARDAQIKETAALLDIPSGQFVREAAVWGTAWLPMMFKRLTGEAWKPEYNDPTYQMDFIASSKPARKPRATSAKALLSRMGGPDSAPVRPALAPRAPSRTRALKAEAKVTA